MHFEKKMIFPLVLNHLFRFFFRHSFHRELLNHSISTQYTRRRWEKRWWGKVSSILIEWIQELIVWRERDEKRWIRLWPSLTTKRALGTTALMTFLELAIIFLSLNKEFFEFVQSNFVSGNYTVFKPNNSAHCVAAQIDNYQKKFFS